MTKLCFARRFLPLLQSSSFGRSFSIRSSSSSLPVDDESLENSVAIVPIKRKSLCQGTENVPLMTVADTIAKAEINQRVAIQVSLQ